MSGETEQNISGWTVDTLHSHVLRLLDRDKDYLGERLARERDRLEERWATQTRAIDAAFSAQQIAMTTAFAAADKAVSAAMAASEKAVDKSERASEARFASVNEFRQSLSDQAGQFISRQEAEARIHSLDAKAVLMIEALGVQLRQMGERIAELQSRMDRTQGVTAGESAAAAAKYRQSAQVVAFGGFLVGLAALALSVYIGSR